jgi:quercetin 2,3-dioxygenase
MQRKDFLAGGFLAIPSLLTGSLSHAHPLNFGAPAEPSNPNPFIVDAGASRFGDSAKFQGVHPNDLKISGKDTDGQLSVFEYTGLAKIGPALHVHLEQDEIFTVLEGSYRFVVGKETHILGAGQTIFLPRNIPHTWIQLTDRGRMIYFLQPAGKMEEFFATMSKFMAPPSPEEIDRIHAAHDMKVVGPPLSL